MFQVNIYTSAIGSVRPATGYWSYVLETMVNGVPRTLEDMGEEQEATMNLLHLTALYRALERMTRPSRITVYTECRIMEGAINRGWLEGWERSGWKTARGSPVKNADIWMGILQQSRGHEVSVEAVGTHAYRGWQQEQMKRLKKGPKR